MKRPTALVILDGLGYNPEQNNNPVAQAHTPTLNYLKKHYPHTHLYASGPAVGLLEGMPGNSEVGHITIGAGRIIKQPITRMHELITKNKLSTLPIIKEKFSQLAKQKKTIHLMGLLSDAGVHSHIEALFAFIRIAQQYNISTIALHCFLDGRDRPPQSAEVYLQQLTSYIKNIPQASIASLCGRFFAMDRNKEWDRTQKTYTMLTMPDQQTQFKNWHDALTYYYEHNITDEFIPPTLLDQQKIITDGDGIVFYNTRPDRARQLTHAFVDPDFSEFKIQKISPAFFITPTRYSKELRTDNVLEKETVPNTLMEILCQHNISTFAIAETEKYAHVTYFFNSGRETEFPSETRVLVPSITATSYKDLPHMQAAHITEHVLQALATNKYDFYLINYANPDMVGHSGDFEATKKAITYIDTQLEILYKKFITEHEGTLYITADHGNAELKYNKELKQAHTEHTTNPVEFIFVNQRVKDKQTELPLKELKDIAPFILQNLNIQVPHQMKA